jgi:hypothetical protein
MTDTPETDKAVGEWDPIPGVCANFARKLERERDEAVRSCHIWQKGHSDIVAERDRLLEALEMLMPQAPNNDCECDRYDRAMWDNAAEALSAVKGESHE